MASLEVPTADAPIPDTTPLRARAAEAPKTPASAAALPGVGGRVLSLPWVSIQILAVEPAFFPVATSVMPLCVEPFEVVQRTLAEARSLPIPEVAVRGTSSRRTARTGVRSLRQHDRSRSCIGSDGQPVTSSCRRIGLLRHRHSGTCVRLHACASCSRVCPRASLRTSSSSHTKVTAAALPWHGPVRRKRRADRVKSRPALGRSAQHTHGSLPRRGSVAVRSGRCAPNGPGKETLVVLSGRWAWAGPVASPVAAGELSVECDPLDGG